MRGVKKKRFILGLAAVVILSGAVYMAGSGFIKQQDVYIQHFSVSEDGRQLTLTLGTDSGRHIREVRIHQHHGGKLYLDCLGAFGGLHAPMGAEDSFVVPLKDDTEMIGLYRNKNAYRMVLQKDMAGVWKLIP